jgi:hypothetical protein
MRMRIDIPSRGANCMGIVLGSLAGIMTLMLVAMIAIGAVAMLSQQK